MVGPFDVDLNSVGRLGTAFALLSTTSFQQRLPDLPYDASSAISPRSGTHHAQLICDRASPFRPSSEGYVDS